MCSNWFLYRLWVDFSIDSCLSWFLYWLMFELISLLTCDRVICLVSYLTNIRVNSHKVMRELIKRHRHEKQYKVWNTSNQVLYKHLWEQYILADINCRRIWKPYSRFLIKREELTSAWIHTNLAFISQTDASQMKQ